MTPESIGLMRGDQQSGAGIVLGKHSGRNAVSTRLNELGYDLDDDKLQAIFVRFKEVAGEKKGGLDDDDLEAFVADEVYSAQAMWRLERVQVTTGSGVVPTATVARQDRTAWNARASPWARGPSTRPTRPSTR